eukprot:154715-Pyramimonas_sp.AAC.1
MAEGLTDIDTFETTYGLPIEPLQPGQPGCRPAVHEWGDCRSEAWGLISYVDASGMHGNHPALAR